MLLAISFALLAAAERVSIAGAIFDNADAPIEGATVYVYTARTKEGPNLLCPSCYADCGKRFVTQSDGSFQLEGLDPSLIFNLLIVRREYAPLLIERIDPQSGPVKAKMSRIDPARLAPDHSVRGRVINSDGQPVRDAIVEPAWLVLADGSWTGTLRSGIDNMSITDERGEFVITSEKPLKEMTIKISARGYAPKTGEKLEPATPQKDIAVVRGATVSGRVFLKGVPLQNVSLGLVQTRSARGPDEFLGPMEVTTNDSGRFSFYCVAPQQDYYIYGIHDSFAPYGALAINSVTVHRDGESVDLGDLTAEKGNNLSGTLKTSDATPLPTDTHLIISRDNAWHCSFIKVGEKGNFDVTNLPSESYSISVHCPGYAISTKNESYSYRSLRGLITRDLENLTILLDPAAPDAPRQSEPFRPELAGKLIAGVTN
ncbi:MAG: carboxypeptidase regulatory-like domain-containing protein [Candidatus Hydrogenedentes bacterium]|nr:carboxypeptidase regulatory-like domain-containing protein [Candidatus Hydrogenedentota bacterium]